jgi:tetratricopeptide (TPR) repeat protein
LRLAVANNENHAEARRLLAVALWQAGQRESSIEQYVRAVRLNPGDERSRGALAEALVAVAQVQRAEEVLNEAVKEIPGSGQAHYLLGKLYEMRGDTLKAANVYSTASKLNPVIGADRLVTRLGSLYARQQKTDAAIAAYREAVAIGPNVGETHERLGHLYRSQNQLDEALAEFSAAAAIDPLSASAHAGMGGAFMRMKRYEDAVAALRRGLRLKPLLRDRYVLAQALLRLGKIEEGKAELEKFKELQAGNEAYEHRQRALVALKKEAHVYMNNGERDKATALLRRTLQYAPDRKNWLEFGMFHIGLGRDLMRAGDYDGAITSFQEVVELKFDYPEIHRHLAEAYERLGRSEESERERAKYGRAPQASPATQGAEP